jgi:hypothetical protein
MDGGRPPARSATSFPVTGAWVKPSIPCPVATIAPSTRVEPLENLTDEETKGSARLPGKARKANTDEMIGKRSTDRRGSSNVHRRKTEEFAVIAYFEEAPEEPVPETLEIRSGNRRLRVPLALRLAPKFRLG